MRLVLTFVAITAVTSAKSAPVEHTLPPATEAAWVAAVQELKTDDGSTVLQALQYAQQLRPTEFKFGSFNGAYQGVTGNPIGIGIDYWIGLKRLDDDSLTILFDIKEENGKPSISYTKTGFTAVEALMSGRDGLLTFIDEEYRQNCIDSENGAALGGCIYDQSVSKLCTRRERRHRH